jgi:hypothetical protein
LDKKCEEENRTEKTTTEQFFFWVTPDERKSAQIRFFFFQHEKQSRMSFFFPASAQRVADPREVLSPYMAEKKVDRQGQGSRASTSPWPGKRQKASTVVRKR